jgi:hypothetical protein
MEILGIKEQELPRQFLLLKTNFLFPAWEED